MSTHLRHDLIIVGAGPVGLALAVALTRFVPGIAVALVDRRPLSVPRDARAFALAAGVSGVLDALGVWQGLAAEATPIRRMRITDSGTGDLARPLFLSFEGDVAPGRPYAHMVPNTAITEALLRAAAGITVIAPAEIADWAAGPALATLTLADGGSVSAPLIVAADGQNSALRGMAGIGVIAHDYGQSGLVGTIAHERDHEFTAYEHFRPAGPFASLPLGGRRSSLVWTERQADAAGIKAKPKAELEAMIEGAMGSALGAVTLEDHIQAFPLRLQLARSFVGPRLALIGDAAHVVHPIAGQGLNLGLKDVAALAETVIEAMRLGLDHGGPDVLARYERWRRFDTALMAAVTDSLNRLFSNDVAPVRALRDFGLGLVDRLAPLKSALIRQAAAVSGSGPRLMRGLPL
jgi:2-octaprenyl-6-methoxyphenol hydroxylase